MTQLFSWMLRGWKSAVLMSWMSMAVSAGNIIVLMPLAIVYLPTNELTLWLLFSTFMSLSILAYLGFTPTTTRANSISLNGAETLKNVIGKTTILRNLYSLSMPVAVIGIIILAVLINNYYVYT